VARAYHQRFAAALAFAALASCSSKQRPGLKITVDLGDFKGAESLKVVISASMGGFAAQMAGKVDGVGVTTEDLDGDGALELVAEFLRPDPTFSFRVTTDNPDALDMHAKAMAFNADDLIASAEGDAAGLTEGGEASIALRLAEDTTPIAAKTRTTDLETATIDVAVLGRQANVNMSSLAVCDVDGDGVQDIVIGAPADDNLNLGATGAIYIIWGGWAKDATVDLSTANARATVFYGTASGENLGAAVACVDLDGDQYDDVIVGAPGADLGRGRVYAVFGRIQFQNSRPVDLASPDHGAEITWTTTTAGAALGSALFAVGPSRPVAPFILASAPGARVTHLLSDVKPPTGTTPRQLDAGAADHPMFTGAAAAALAAGDLDGTTATSGKLDIAIADPTYRDVSDTAMRRGRVYVFADVAPTGTAPIDVAAASPIITGGAMNSQLGTALLIADTSGGGQDLFIGAPGDGGTGVVYVFAHDDGLLLPPTLDPANAILIAGSEPGGLFGSALAATRAGSTSAAGLRLAVGAPNVARGNNRIAAGAAYLYRADTQRKFRIYEQVYGAAAGDALGSAVGGGQLNVATDDIGDLVTAAPNAGGGTGVVYVRYGQ
jgi:hypothetical protein